MTKTELLALDALANSSLKEVQTSNPGLAKLLLEKIGAQRREMVLAAFAGSSKELLEALGKIDFAPGERDLPLREVVALGLASQKVDEKIIKEAEGRLLHLERAGRLRDTINFDAPISRLPLFRPELEQAEIYKLTDSVKLSDQKAEALVTAARSPIRISDEVLEELVANKTFADEEAAAVGVAISLYRLAGDRADLAAAIKPKVPTLAALARLSVRDWEEAITASKTELPEGLDEQSYAAALRRAASSIFSSDTLIELNHTDDTDWIPQALTDLEPLRRKNDKLFGSRFDELDTSGVDAKTAESLRDKHVRLHSLAHQHPGLELNDILDSKASPAEKAALLKQRLSITPKLRTLNSEAELLALDYTNHGKDLETLKTDGISPAEREMAIKDLKAMQRVHWLARDVDHTGAIMGAGYHSGVQIANEKFEHFRERTGLPEAAARRIHESSKHILRRSSVAAFGALDAYENIFDHLHVGNKRPEVNDYLEKIPGFSDLFGNQDMPHCEECQSIIGAPAYFVDLMNFIEEHITRRVFTGEKARDQLNLRNRRPDLWALPLTCEHTNNEIPYLDIIIDVLQK